LLLPTEFTGVDWLMHLKELIAFDAFVSLRVVMPLGEGVTVRYDFFLLSRTRNELYTVSFLQRFCNSA